MKDNKKGFTLVELLAVIVILALIMGIAVVSIGGVLNSARQSTFKDTALSVIHGVSQQVTLANQLPASGSASYAFEAKILEKGGDSPLGGSIKFVGGLSNGKVNMSSTSTANNQDAVAIGGMGIYKITGTVPACSDKVNSYVTISKDSTTNVYSYSVCLTAGEGYKYIEGTENELLDSNNTAVIKP